MPSAGRFSLTVAPDWREFAPDVDRAQALIATEPLSILHDSERGLVTVVATENGRLVVKRSRLEAANHWRRLVSLVRGGDSTRAFRNQCRLRALGLAVPEPVLALDRRRFGFVLDSWHVYRHVAGRPCTVDDAARIAAVLAQMHACGWVHRDPHVANFLDDGERIVILDCARARRRPWRYAKAYDFVLLEKCCRGFGRNESFVSNPDIWYRLARRRNRSVVGWRRLKQSVRTALRIRRPHEAQDAKAAPRDA